MRSDGTEMSNLTVRTLVGAGGFHSDLFRLFDKGTEVSQKELEEEAPWRQCFCKVQNVSRTAERDSFFFQKLSKTPFSISLTRGLHGTAGSG